MADLAWGGCTHVGHVRAVNEDRFVAAPPIFVVADGMGGHDHGEVASAVVADEFARLAAVPDLNAELVAASLDRSHAEIRALETGTENGREMGTTVAGIAWIDAESEPKWLLFNVGDSRVYRYELGSLEQLSVDHSVIQELVAAGDLTEEQARRHPDRHVITRAVGLDAELVPDFVYRAPVVGERFLLCSDGVHDELSDGAIAEVLSGHADPVAAAKGIVESVLQGTARDNVSAVVVDVLSIDAAREEDIVSEDTGPHLLVPAPVPVETPAELAPTMIEVPQW